MKAQDIRAKFLDFFTDKEHKIVASAPCLLYTSDAADE